ncbi:MAG: AAA family ATPase [Verrucomicrobia bacterium]|nr:AAA family ATPase [Verrucomicrobiota bacterium]
MWRSRFNLSAILSGKARTYLFIVPLGMIVGGAWSAYRASGLPSTFSSSGRLVMSGRLNFSEGNPVANDFMAVLGTQLEILTSEELRERAMIKLRLEHPDAMVRPDLGARQVPRTTIFELTATSGGPTHVQRYLDLVMEEYITMRREQRLVSSRSVMDQISGEIARLEKILNEQEAELFRFKQQRNIVFWEQQSTTAARFLSQLKNREASLRMQLRLAELLDRGAVTDSLASRVGALELGEAVSARPRTETSGPSRGSAVTVQRLKLRELEVEFEAMREVFRPKHPRFQKLEGDIAKLRRLVGLLETEDAAAFRREVDGIRSELETILASMGEWEAKVLESTQIEAEHQKLQSTTARTRDLYQRLVASLQNIDFRKGVDDEVIQVLKRAGVVRESKPDSAGEVRRGIGLGLLVGLGLLMLAVRLDRRAFAVAEVAKALELDVAAEIPALRSRFQDRIAMADPKCPGAFAEAIRSLRATLALERTTATGGQVVVISSSSPGEGKSTLSLNLALAAAGAGVRTLLVDADVRRGTIAQRLGLSAELPGFADLIRGTCSFDECVRPAGEHGFSVMTAGRESARVVDAMMLKFPSALTTEAREKFDLVLIDSAPVIPVSDTVPFISRVDRVLYVVRLRTATLMTMKKALLVLRRSAKKDPLLVINGARPSDGNFDYYDYSSSYGS